MIPEQETPAHTAGSRPVRVRRGRATRPGVKLAERAAGLMIRIAGFGTIVAVATICGFLLWVVAPLFFSAKVGVVHASPRQAATEASKPRRIEVDEYRRLAWILNEDGSVESRRLDSAEILERVLPFGASLPTAMAFARGAALFGFADGSLRFGRIGFSSRVQTALDVPAEQRALESGQLSVFDHGLLERTGEDQFRVQRLEIDLEEPIAGAHPSPVLLLDHTSTETQRRVAALHEDGTLALYTLSERTNLISGETSFAVSEGRIPYKPDAARGVPQHLVLASGGSSLYLVWRDGLAQRFDTRDIDNVKLAEVVDLVREPDAEVTVITTLLGETSLVVGDTTGRCSVWFPIRPLDVSTADGQLLTRVHELAGSGSAVTAIGASERSRMVAVGHENGEIDVFYATSARRIANTRIDGAESVLALDFAPKEDGLAALSPHTLWSADFDPRHPEAGVAGIFAPVWYEGYVEPAHVWQSSSGTDDFEPKLGMMPLIFGTLKATFYSLLFGVPLALLAAIYSNEFLNPKLRVPVKSGIEMMASLPSVVLGFIAAIILAPFVQTFVPAVIAGFFAIPLSLLLGAYLWQLLPARFALRWADLQRFGFIALAMPVGVVLAMLAAPLLERLFFGGDFILWLHGGAGGALGGWLFLLLPLSVAVTALMAARHVEPWLRTLSVRWERATCARIDLLRFCLCLLASLLLALAGAWMLTALGFDARGSLLGTYVQRNALVVGFVMGFAIIPIIYTLAEDALSSVPAHLRLASLSCGATPWQTAMRVIIPTAMSGIFSAVMIGMGRAVGETMIVLMAAGNTPVMDMNVFNGFRTLSANIATELPEAVQDSTHYRMLFLAALCLFAITFLVNTAAELVRQRFRKRAFQL
ncbi:MAG TPA: ABC transporter permease subunit [Planctomycetota bacterium]|nr:ABC transporter permease subunit [Planctomycetota bacterium]